VRVRLPRCLSQAIAATRRLIEKLREASTIRARDRKVDEGVETMTGKAYADGALRDVYICCGAIAMPTFYCGSSFTHFSKAVGPVFGDLCTAAAQTKRRTWSLVQLELRRADTNPGMVSLLLEVLGKEGVTVLQQKDVGAPSEVFYYGSSGTLEGQMLRTLIAAKRRAIEIMQLAPGSADGHTPDEALKEALMDACEIRRTGASQATEATAHGSEFQCSAPRGGLVRCQRRRRPCRRLREGGSDGRVGVRRLDRGPQARCGDGQTILI
jgi:hypothetical protein